MPSVYIETTIPSYLVARPSRDLVIAAHQQITHEWWMNASHRFDLYVSELVLAEIREGDPDIASMRMKLIQGCKLLSVNLDVRELTNHYRINLGLSGKALADIPHFAFAVAHKMDYLVTWNCTHIANGEIIRRLIAINSQLGRTTPLIVTPEELLDSTGGNNHDK